jgi:hypothetical protein
MKGNPGTGRPHWLVFGEGQQWRAKTAENTGDWGRSFRPFLRAFDRRKAANEQQTT